MLEVVLAPRVPTLYHTHTHDQVGVTIAPGLLRNQVLGEDTTSEEPPDPAGDVWFESYPNPITHRGTNLGDEPIHFLIVELLGSGSARRTTLPSAPGRVVLENRRVRASRLRLEPGAATPTHAHETGVVIGSLSDGTIAPGGGADSRRASPGFVSWQEPTRLHVIRNAGDEPLELVELEILH